MKMISYRLAQYKIIENENGDLWWECYADFATTNSGKCFIAANILFLEPYSEVSEPGYLILEYNELLNKLPQWEKTKYYCSSYTIRTCKTGRAPPKKELSKRSRKRTERVANSLTTEVPGSGGIKPKQSDETNAISYRLAQYEIIENENGEVWWKAHAGLGRLRRGKCFIEDDILFIGASKADLKKPGESGFLRREFLKHLNQLPKWEKAKYYCYSYTLQTYNTSTTGPTKAISKRSGEWTENTTRQLISKMWNAATIFRQLRTGDTYVKFKKYINGTQKWIVLMGACLLLMCAGFLAVLSDRLKRKQNGSYQQTRNRHDDDVHNDND